MNRFELCDKVARNSQCLLPQHFRLLVALWSQHPAVLGWVWDGSPPAIAITWLYSRKKNL